MLKVGSLILVGSCSLINVGLKRNQKMLFYIHIYLLTGVFL